MKTKDNIIFRINLVLLIISVFLTLLLIRPICNNLKQEIPLAENEIDLSREYEIAYGPEDVFLFDAIARGVFDFKYDASNEDSLFDVSLSNTTSQDYSILSINVLSHCGIEEEQYSYSITDARRLDWCRCTSDGGMIIRIEAIEKEAMIIKISNEGVIEWIYSSNDGCEFFVETEHSYIFAGYNRNHGNKYSIRFLRLGKEGEFLGERVVGGTMYDYVRDIWIENGNICFICSVQSRDGHFSDLWDEDDHNYIDVLGTISEDLTDLKIQRSTYDTMFPWRIIGFHNGREARDTDEMFFNYPFGYPISIVDFDDGYLIVSRVPVEGVYEYSEFSVAIINSYRLEFTYFDYSDELQWQILETV